MDLPRIFLLSALTFCFTLLQARGQIQPVGIATQVDEPAEPLYPKGLLEAPTITESDGAEQETSGELDYFIQEQMEPRHAVAVAVVGRGTKRHKLLEELADDTDLYPVVAISARFARGATSVMLHTPGYPAQVYEGKWTRGAMKKWLLEFAYPLVNRIDEQFPVPKYLVDTTFGAVLIVQPLGEKIDELVQILEPYAAKYKSRLKFSFFHKIRDPEMEHLCKMYGVRTDNELLVLERPWEFRTRKHKHRPENPKYRLEGVTSERLGTFFEQYDAGTWPRYFRSASPPLKEPIMHDGVRELTGWDFVETVSDPRSAVLVAFVSSDCSACQTFASTYREVARRLRDARRQSESSMLHLTLARIDQSENDHSEFVEGTPLLRYWPRGKRKRTTDIDKLTADAIWDFLEDRASEEGTSAEL